MKLCKNKIVTEVFFLEVEIHQIFNYKTKDSLIDNTCGTCLGKETLKLCSFACSFPYRRNVRSLGATHNLRNQNAMKRHNVEG